MSSQRVTRVATQAQSGRKRHLSLPSVNETLTKMAKGDDGSRVKAKAKRSLYQSAPTPAPRNTSAINNSNAHTESDSLPDVRQLIATLSSDIHMQ